MSTPTSTILVVDDEAHGRELLADILTPLAARLLTAADGSAALALAAEHLPDLVLLDVMMPGMDGFEVCRRLRADERLREIPIVMLTALDDRESRLQGLAAGADSFLTKPFDHAELRTRVTTITRLNRYRLLATERERFAQLFATAPDALLVTDAQFTIRLANPAAHALFGDAPDQPLEGDLLLCHLGLEEAVLSRLKQLLAGEGRAFQFELTGARANHTRVPIEAAAGRFTWAGQPALQLHLRDVSEKKQMEAQFLRVQRLQGLGSLAGGVAHDLNNIFAPMLMTADLLADTLADRPEARLVQSLKVTVWRGTDLVRQILTFARGTADEKQAVLPRYLLNELRSILAQSFPPHIKLHINCEPDTPPILANPTHLHQVLMNLSVNARDAMPHGGQLRLTAALCELAAPAAAALPGASPGQWVRFSVTDTGTGMTPEVRARLGEAFFTTKPLGQGTGLGLSTTFGIVKSHGGWWRIETEPGKGTTFELHFPPATSITGAAAPEPEQHPAGRGELILLADDEAAVLELARATLGCYGYRTLCARDGAEAIALFCRDANEIKLVLADCQMPYLDGPALIRALRKLQPAVRCALTSASDATTIAAELDGGPVPYLPKPYSASQLLTLLNRELHER